MTDEEDEVKFGNHRMVGGEEGTDSKDTRNDSFDEREMTEQIRRELEFNEKEKV